MSDIIAKDTESLEISEEGAVVSLFEILITGTINILCFHPENTSEKIIFNGKTYEAFPIGLEGLEISSEGSQNRPTLIIPNVESLLNSNSTFRTALGNEKFTLDDLIGARITRRKTLFKYVRKDSEYDEQNPPAAYELPKAVYIVDRISAKSDIAVELELASPFDLSGTRIPSRNVVGKYCPWLYKGYSPSTTDVASACRWRNTEQIQIQNESGGTDYYTLFFNSFDEPVINSNVVASLNAEEWTEGSGPYSKGDFITSNGVLYGAKSDHQVSLPSDETYWQIYRTFTDGWSSSTTYTVVPENTRKNDYVYAYNRLWRVINPNNLGIRPGTDYSVWVEGDVCGKLISSCKKRFQAKIHENSGTNFSAVPEPGQFNTSVVLPFGGFPGTRKFR